MKLFPLSVRRQHKTKLIMKCGDIEVDFEGSEEFLKGELPGLIKTVAQLRSPAGATRPPVSRSGSGAGSVASSELGELSVSTIAQKLGVKSGAELIMAAALSFGVAGSTAFTKKQLRTRCREATTFFRSAYANNFDNYVARLVKGGRLNHTGGENYALPATEQQSLAATIAAVK